ncbi:MAG: NAD(P)/FAD-dependent oxidoreductase [Gammaproteobacteria bacterium]|nr:NAD(P)/FAD-dependent oxidoreductase [Gammaproteobacteria bacterium]
MVTPDVIIIGAGAAGLMCAIEAGKRGRNVLVIDHARKSGNKIRMSGGGRCNFTNYHIDADNYLSNNPHFCKSALSRYTQWDFIDMVQRYHIPYHERSHGQLFCNDTAKDILDMLLAECKQANVRIKLKTTVQKIEKISKKNFRVLTDDGAIQCQSLVIATGGLSIPTMGASSYGYQVASQFGHHVWPTHAGLVPFTWQPVDKEKYASLTGIAVDSLVTYQNIQFRENLLFTHRGLSGPAILQISSYWQTGDKIEINLLPELDVFELLSQSKIDSPQKKLRTLLQTHLPKRLISIFIDNATLDLTLQSLTEKQLQIIAQQLQSWHFKPNGTEGYRTAEVTLGGVDCNEISSKTMESQKCSDLYFIGEVVDVTGWLGGYNFQWAWSSGWCAGQYV